MDVTKEQFDEAYAKYGPRKFLRFIYTHYNVKLKRKPTPVGTLLAVIGWTIGTIGIILFDQLGMKEMAMNFLWAYIPFASMLISLPAFLMHQARIRKIAKELGITLQEYNNWADLYLDD